MPGEPPPAVGSTTGDVITGRSVLGNPGWPGAAPGLFNRNIGFVLQFFFYCFAFCFQDRVLRVVLPVSELAP